MTSKVNIEKNILQALEMFGPLRSEQVLKKLRMRDIDVRLWEVEQILKSMHINRLIASNDLETYRLKYP